MIGSPRTRTAPSVTASQASFPAVQTLIGISTLRYNPLALGLWAFWGRAPLFFVFCFPLPPTTPDTPGPYAAVLFGRLKTFGLDHKPGKKVSFLGVKKSHSYSYRIIAAAKRSIVAGVRSEKLRVTVRGGALAS